MLKKQYLSVIIFCLSLILLVVYQNCAEVGGNIDFGSCQAGDERCEGDPDQLSLNLDPGTLSNESFNLPIYSSSGGSTLPNLIIKGTCNTDNFSRVMVRLKIYECFANNCTTLKYTASSVCSPILKPNKFQISKSIQEPTLVPGRLHKIKLETYALNEFGQEIFGRNSRLPDKSMNVVRTIRPPILSSFSSTTNFWDVSKETILYSLNTPSITLEEIRGFCDYSATGGNAILVRLEPKGFSVPELIFSTASCTQITTGTSTSISESIYRNGRTGYFTTDTLPVSVNYMYSQSWIPCGNNTACQTNPLNRISSRFFKISATQTDVTSNIPVRSERNLLLHFTNESAGKGWLAEVFQEVLKRIKKSFTFSISDEPSGALDTDDLTQAMRVLSSTNEFAHPILPNERYGYGTRYWIVNRLFGTIEDINGGIQNKVQFLGSATTYNSGGRLRYKSIAAANEYCSINSTIPDLIEGAAGDIETKRIAACLTFRYLNGIWGQKFEDTKKYVEVGIRISAGNCFFKIDGPSISVGDCQVIQEFLTKANTFKSRFAPGGIASASDLQLKYFGNAMTQAYINKIMRALNLRISNENNIFKNVFETVYGIETDPTIRTSVYPVELNYPSSTTTFGLMKSLTSPITDLNFPSGSEDLMTLPAN